MQAIQQRQKAKLVILFASVLTRDAKNRVKSVLVPGSKGKQYKVILCRSTDTFGFSTITTECLLLAGKNECTCQGNNHKKAHKPCYHSQCAVDLALDDAGFSGSWCWNWEDANRLNQIKKGSIVAVQSVSNPKQLAWVVVVKR